MAQPVGELATATILFTDVVGSTATHAQLGEELADRVFARHAALLRAAARAHRSVFLKSVGDGVMAVFQSATMGLRAAAAIQFAVDTENRRSGTTLEVRGGLSTGDIVWTDDDVDGLPAVEAARLAGAAGGGQVLCSELTARLAVGREGLEFKEIGDLELKGLPRPLATVEVLWWQHTTTPTPAPVWLTCRDVIPLVGRDTELAALSAFLEQANDGPSVALITGGAGSGKTRLLSTAVGAAVSQGHILLAGRCSDPPTGPLEPFAEAVAGLAARSPRLLLDAQRSEDLVDLARLAPVLSEAPFGLEPVPLDDQEAAYLRLATALSALLKNLCSTSAVLLVIEDLHWATTSTLRLLRGLLLQLEETPIRMVASVREAELPDRHTTQTVLGELLIRPDVARLDVGPLSADSIFDAMTSSAPEGGAPIRRADAQRIADISGGNAFLVSETIRELRSGHAVGGTEPPDTIRRFITSRLARAGAIAHDVICLVACASRLDVGALRHALAVDEATYADAVDEAIATGLVVVTNDGVVAMAHELARAGVTAGLAEGRQALLHRRLVDALTATDPELAQNRPYLLAEHLVAIAWLGQHDDLVSARDTTRSAARHASSRLAFDEAVGWLERSLQFHQRLREGSPVVRAELMLELGRAKWRSGDPDAHAVLRDAGRLGAANGRPDLLIAAALAGNRGFFSSTEEPDEDTIEMLTIALAAVDEGDLASHAELLAGLAAELTWSPAGDQRFALSDQSLELARRSGDEQTLIRVLAARSLTISASDTLDQRLLESEELIRLAQRTDDDLLRFHAVFQRTGPLLEIGDTQQIAERLDDARRLAQTLGQPELRWLVEFSTAGLELIRGEIGPAEARAIEALGLGTAAGRRSEARAFFAEQLAEIRRLQGRLGELEGPMRAAVERGRLDPVHAVMRYLCELGGPGLDQLLDRVVGDGLPPRRDVAQRAALDNLVVVAAHLHRCDVLPVLYDALLPSGHTFGHGAVAHPCGHHFLGIAAAAMGEVDGAEHHFQNAVAVHDRARVPLLMAESLIEWLELLDRRGDGRSPLGRDLAHRASTALVGRDATFLSDRLEAVDA